MKPVRIIAVFLAFLIPLAIARGDDPVTDVFPNGDPLAYTITEGIGGTGLGWGGTYTLAPGETLYSLKVTAYDANLRNFPATVTTDTGKRTWEAKTDALPSGTYKMKVTIYTVTSLGTILKGPTVYSTNSVTIP